MYYALVHKKTHKRIDLGSKSEFIRWIKQHRFSLNQKVASEWLVYRTEKSEYNRCRRLLSQYLYTLYEFMSNNKLLNYGKKEKINPAVVPCGNRID